MLRWWKACSSFRVAKLRSSFTAERSSDFVLGHRSPVKLEVEVAGEPKASEFLDVNLSGITSGLRGEIPVDLKELSINFSPTVVTQASQNSSKKSLFLIGGHHSVD